MIKRGMASLAGINRNIVECKGSKDISSRLLSFRINRNIVECKDDISTSKTEFDTCINRNIVECKESTSESFSMNALSY